MRRGSDEEKDSRYQKDHYRFVRPPDKSIKMTSHPGSDIKENEKPPRRNAQESQYIEHQQLKAFRR